MTQQTASFPLGGGLDLVSSPGKMPPGRCIAALNYEPTASGYQRFQGFERFDGQPAPSEATYWRINFTAGDNNGTVPTVGQAIRDSTTSGVVHIVGRIVAVVTTSGAWATDDAAGYFIATSMTHDFTGTTGYFSIAPSPLRSFDCSTQVLEYAFDTTTNLVTNGTFTPATGWVLTAGTGVAPIIDDGVLTFTGTDFATGSLTTATNVGELYEIAIEVLGQFPSTNFVVQAGGVTTVFPIDVGTLRMSFTATTASTVIVIYPDGPAAPISLNSISLTIGDYTKAAIAATRGIIQVVPGEGPVRGIWGFAGSIFAFRDAVGAASASSWTASSVGWTLVSNLVRVDFTTDTGAGETLPDTKIPAPPHTKNAITKTSGGAAKGTVEAVTLTGTVGTVTTGYYLLSSYVAGTWTAAGQAIYSGSTRVGTTTAAATTTATLPAGGRYFFLNHNFYGAQDRAAMYVVNGVGTALVYNGAGYAPISTGMTYDTPTRLAVHRNALFLAFPGGSLQFSNTGEPLLFDPILGAGEIGVGSEITDLISANKTTLTILAESSISVLYGNDSTDYQLVTLTEADGDEAVALPFTAQRLGNVLYMDNVGIRSISATATYGNFNLGSISRLIEPLLRDFRKDGVNPVASLTWKRKDQYWVFFDNDTALVLYLGQKDPQILPLDLGFTVTCATTITIDGIERAFVGTTTGYVKELDKGTSFDGDDIEHYFALPYNTFGSPEMEKRAHKVTLNLEASGTTTLSVSVNFDYGSVAGLAAQQLEVTTGGGALDDLGSNEAYFASQIETQAEVYIDGVARNFSLKVSGLTSTEEAHTATSVTFHLSQRGLKR